MGTSTAAAEQAAQADAAARRQDRGDFGSRKLRECVPGLYQAAQLSGKRSAALINSVPK